MAYIIAGIELQKVYREEKGKHFIGNLEVTDCCENLTLSSTSLTLRDYKVNELLASKSINLSVDRAYIEFNVDVPYNNIEISKLEEGLTQAEIEFSKLGILKKPKLMMFDYYEG